MRKAKHLVTRLLVIALIAYATFITSWTFRLQKRLTGLETTHQKLQERHHFLKEGYLQLVRGVASNDQSFRKALAVLESDGGVDLDSPFSASITEVNLPTRGE